MKILDKNKDFYDYLQGIYPDDTFTFDRRSSYNLSKEEFMESFIIDSWKLNRKFNKFDLDDPHICFILLQVCNTFWLFKMTVTKTEKSLYSWYYNVKDYNLELIKQWKNYAAPKELLLLSIIERDHYYSKIEEFYKDVENGIYKYKYKFTNFSLVKGNNYSQEEEKKYPILQHIGIAGLVDPLDIYNSLEEYFSSEKTASERSESIGITDKEKIVNHGFDTKTSFRGKNK